MMRQYELVERVQSYDPSADEALLNRAYIYAMKAHGHQKRKSGDPYFSHPLEVAAILTDLKLDAATVATGLLHDVIEDTDATRSEIDQLFGSEIGALVDGLTKIRRLDLVSKKTQQAENFRKLLVAISSDIRVLLVKLADRLHNMRTLEHMSPKGRKRISEETLDIYAPLAGRMGMQALREELETLAFQWLNAEAFETVSKKLKELRDKNKGLVEEIRTALVSRLSEVGIDAQVNGREKKAYSIWRKMENKQISLEQLSDIYAFRVIVNDVLACYNALGVVHTTWNAVPGRFKDYVSTPKPNGYQSIHTTLVGPRYQRVELQVRTYAMHNIAEYGVASHSFYKNPSAANGNTLPVTVSGAVALDRDSGPYTWLRRLVETLLEGANSEEFLEHTKLELFRDQVFCFTPKGRLIALPQGATPLDFAYAVHSDVGNAAVGAYLNGRHMPIDTQLRNGDEVEVVTSKAHTHPAAWEGFAVTGRARSAIRRAARETVRRQYSGLGRRLLTRAIEAAGATYSDSLLKDALPKLGGGQKTADDLLAGIGRNEVDILNVVKACLPDAKLPDNSPDGRAKKRKVTARPRWGRSANQEGWFNLSKVMGLKFRLGDTSGKASKQEMPGAGLPIRGLSDDLPVSYDEGGAIPGDRIVGVLVPNEGVRIFQVHSPRLKEYEHADWIDVTWDIDVQNPEQFRAAINVVALNEPGTLAQIAQLIGEESGNIDHLQMIRRGVDFTEMRIEVEVWDLSHLNHIIKGLNAKSVVSSVERVFD